VKRFVSLQFLNLRHSIRLLGRVISPSQGRYLTQTGIHASIGIRNREPSVRASEDSSHSMRHESNRSSHLTSYPRNRIYCDTLPESRNIGGCISDCFLENGVPNTGNRRIAAVPLQRKRQHTSATELSDQVLPIQSAKRLLKAEHSKDSRER
jgi:hypothetical protein